MKKTTLFVFVTSLSLALGLMSCAGSKKKTLMDSQDMSETDLSLELNGDSDSGKAGNLRTVHFNFNSSSLTDETRELLERNAEYLKENSSIEIQIEGHCDERGGIQYNLALGEQRAMAVKNYLTSLGVSSEKMGTISFGKERPIAFGHTESFWAKNRRANFVITAK